MDFRVLLASYPSVLRGALRHFVAASIIGSVPRLAGRAHRPLRQPDQGAARALDPGVPGARQPPSRRAPGRGEVRRYYRSDARTWSWIQRLRRADRAWHRLRKRTYPYLIPGEIER